MLLYHASNLIVSEPDTAHSRDNLDFGKGFYLTSIYEQAASYANRFTRRGQKGYINSYEFSIDHSQWNIIIFDKYDKNWLDFVAKCRAGIDAGDYDLVIGGIANDKVIRTLDRYFDGRISMEEALGLLFFEKPNIQYCIRSQQLLTQCLTYKESIEL